MKCDKTLILLTFEGMSWQKPRKTIDLLLACIQAYAEGQKRSMYIPMYYGLLSPQEKEEFLGNIEELKRTLLHEKPNPRERLENALHKWKEVSYQHKNL